MESHINNNIIAKEPTEKERLEIVERKVEIQRKRLEIKKEKINMNDTRRKAAMEEERTLLEKITELRGILTDWTVDDERTIMASETFLTPVLVGKQRELAINKLLELIKRV